MRDSYLKYEIAVREAKAFLYGQKELYKIEYIKSEDDNYLEVMNSMNNTAKTLISMDLTIVRQAKEIKELKDKLDKATKLEDLD